MVWLGEGGTKCRISTENLSSLIDIPEGAAASHSIGDLDLVPEVNKVLGPKDKYFHVVHTQDASRCSPRDLGQDIRLVRHRDQTML